MVDKLVAQVVVLLDDQGALAVLEQSLERLLLVQEVLAMRSAPISGVHLEERVRLDGPLFSLIVVVGAVRLFADAPVLNSTFVDLVIGGVVLKFFPAVAGPAAVLQATAVLVGFDILLSFPGDTLRGQVLEPKGRPPEVLPVVRVDALIALVVFVREGAPHSLKVKQVEVNVDLHAIEHSDGEFRLVVGEGADVAVLTVGNLVWVCGAELSFVLFGVVKVLHPVVAADAVVLERALLFEAAVAGVGTHL